MSSETSRGADVAGPVAELSRGALPAERTAAAYDSGVVWEGELAGRASSISDMVSSLVESSVSCGEGVAG